VSYGDMITLLLTFFILFMNLQRKDTETIEIQKSLLVEFKKTSDEKSVGSSTHQAGVQDQIQVGNQKAPGVEEATLNEWGGEVVKYSNRIVVNFPEVSFFKVGKYQVTSEGQKALNNFAKKYVPYAGRHRLVVTAYTDHLPVRKMRGRTFTDNLELSAIRSVRALRILQKAGIPLNEMRVGGFGELKGIRFPASQSIVDQKAKKHGKEKGDPLSRKVVLMIEPLPKEENP
jgi:chemotaxis protein MotB